MLSGQHIELKIWVLENKRSRVLSSPKTNWYLSLIIKSKIIEADTIGWNTIKKIIFTQVYIYVHELVHEHIIMLELGLFNNQA